LFQEESQIGDVAFESLIFRRDLMTRLGLFGVAAAGMHAPPLGGIAADELQAEASVGARDENCIQFPFLKFGRY
jgi:hypothetical protein